jgi:uncharacterized protein (DUF58 family)
MNSKRSPLAGFLTIGGALLLTAVYFRVPQIARNWPFPGHVFFRGLVILLGLSGLMQVIGSFSNSRLRVPAWVVLTQHRMSIPLEGWIYLSIIIVLFTGAMLTKQNTLFLVFALMAGPFVINGWMTFGMLQAARVQRMALHRAMQGELFSVDVSLHNSRPLFAIWMMSIRDEIAHSRESLSATVLFSRVSPRTTQSGQYQLRLSQRGRYRFGPLRAASRFPLGLVERSRVFRGSDEILIYPRIGKVSPAWKQKLSNATELVTRMQPHHGVFHDDFHQLREFRSGDNPRAIHWRSTARRGELILREFQQNREHMLSIVLDLFWPPSAPNSFREQTELALSFVASILAERGRECRDGLLTLAAAGDRTFHWEGHGTPTSLEPLLDGLAVFEPGPSRDIVDLLNSTLQHSSSMTQILLVTTRTAALPYQHLLTSRVDVLNLSEIANDQLLTYDIDSQFRRMS